MCENCVSDSACFHDWFEFFIRMLFHKLSRGVEQISWQTAALAVCRPILCAKIMSKMSNKMLCDAFQSIYTSNCLIRNQTVMVTKPQIYNASEHSVCNLKKGSQEARIVLRP